VSTDTQRKSYEMIVNPDVVDACTS